MSFLTFFQWTEQLGTTASRELLVHQCMWNCAKLLSADHWGAHKLPVKLADPQFYVQEERGE
jgi:hypothetical protein